MSEKSISKYPIDAFVKNYNMFDLEYGMIGEKFLRFEYWEIVRFHIWRTSGMT